ncbi:hypothetical protein NP493_460g04039 [Ridgeia piscesae]|uniref:Uncharacterized protein n=1 Tax=Ridgeia piscesae TaxID=27915 RepID=A0AAD9NTG2_RIDPI|nr:hypothetical protein NP493_460g04039 [Ridgeia piscesae]
MASSASRVLLSVDRPRRVMSLSVTCHCVTATDMSGVYPPCYYAPTGVMLLSSSSCRHGDQPRQTMTSPTDTDNVRSSTVVAPSSTKLATRDVSDRVDVDSINNVTI